MGIFLMIWSRMHWWSNVAGLFMVNIALIVGKSIPVYGASCVGGSLYLDRENIIKLLRTSVDKILKRINYFAVLNKLVRRVVLSRICTNYRHRGNPNTCPIKRSCTPTVNALYKWSNSLAIWYDERNREKIIRERDLKACRVPLLNF